MATMAHLRAAQAPKHGIGGQTLLLCIECGAEYSADPSDYFWKREDEHFMCCKRRTRLVRKSTRYERCKTGETR